MLLLRFTRFSVYAELFEFPYGKGIDKYNHVLGEGTSLPCRAPGGVPAPIIRWYRMKEPNDRNPSLINIDTGNSPQRITLALDGKC